MTVVAVADVVELDSPQTRIVDATLRCVARWGLAKTTVDDVAREAGVGRATLYRLFPGGRDALFDAVVSTELARLLARVERAACDATGVEDVVAAAMREGGSTLLAHDALQFLLAHEPESILPLLAFQQMDALLRGAADLLRPLLAPWLTGDAAERTGEWVARVLLSYVVAPSPHLDFSDPVSVRQFVHTYILPGIVPGADRP